MHFSLPGDIWIRHNLLDYKCNLCYNFWIHKQHCNDVWTKNAGFQSWSRESSLHFGIFPCFWFSCGLHFEFLFCETPLITRELWFLNTFTHIFENVAKIEWLFRFGWFFFKSISHAKCTKAFSCFLVLIYLT